MFARIKFFCANLSGRISVCKEQITSTAGNRAGASGCLPAGPRTERSHCSPGSRDGGQRTPELPREALNETIVPEQLL